MNQTRPVALVVRNACLLLGVFAAVLTAGSERLPVAPTPNTLRLNPYIANLRTLDVSIGSETTPFLFDTGGGFTVLTPDVARAAGCVPFGQVTGFRASGERLDLPRCGPVALKLGPVTIRTEAAILDLMTLLKGAPSIGGLVSLQTFEGGAFTLDLAGNRLVVETPQSLAPRVRTMRQLSLRMSRQAGGAALDVFLEVNTSHGSIWLELDSGNAGPALLSAHALTQLGMSLPGDQPQRVMLNLKGLNPIPVDVAAKELIYDGLLNAAVLESIVLTVDLRSARAWATLRH
jgi:hypothetical protein